jgi:uncharacterized protein (TIGR03118 family)
MESEGKGYTMKASVNKLVLVSGTLLMALVLTSPAGAQFYKQTNLVSDISSMATITDSKLVNPWGVSHSPGSTGSPFWVSDAGTSFATLYKVDATTGTITKLGLEVHVPVPSGQLFNGTTDFVVTSGPSSGPAAFIFAGLNGNIYGWNPNVPPPSPSHQAQLGAAGVPSAAYTGITIGSRSGVQLLYAANAAGNRIDVYDHTFTNVNASFAGKFVDPSLPAGFVPFNIANINGNLYVSYTPANPVVVGPGAINVFDTDGNFIKRFATGGPNIPLLDPWGMAVAPADFGKFANALLVGNFNTGNAALGPGHISAFSLAPDADNGKFLGVLEGTDGKPLSIDGLWQLIFGNGGSGGNPSVLYFSAGIQNQAHGLFGSLSTCHGPVISGASASPTVLWPPNNKLVPVAVDYSVADDCDSTPRCSLSTTVADSGGGIDNTADSAIVVDAHTVELRASRNGGGDGRVYSIEISCTDRLPLSSSTTVTVTVPHDQRQ